MYYQKPDESQQGEDQSEASGSKVTPEEEVQIKAKAKLAEIQRRIELRRNEDEEDDIQDVNATVGHLKPRAKKQPIVSRD